MSPKARMWLLVGLVSVAAAGATVGATLLTRTGTGGATNAAPVKQKGRPPLLLDLGIRTDPQATALRRGEQLYGDGRVKAAIAVFGRYRSLEAQVGLAVADWPAGLTRLGELARARPASAVVQLNYGVGLFWQGELTDAQTAWRKAKAAQPDTAYAVRAGDLLHPRDASGLPQFVPSFPVPAAVVRLESRPVVQYGLIRDLARRGGVRAKLLFGVELQSIGRPISARHEFAAAAALAPHDADAQVAAAVGLFDKDRPSLAFSRLGPLVRVFPKATTVRFHLGLMLIYIGQLKAAKVQLEKVVAAGPSPFFRTTQFLLSKFHGK